ncbi:Leucine-rich repeat domain superfamily [Sesbania bispinosa]|nr:Leucine-rich repeat domain superfamily [Sesbania bispinosa]
MRTSNTDMLSLLPDSVLLLILSMLPFKEAVKTSVLSKPWMKICHSMENIEFNELSFVKQGESDEAKKEHRRVFLNFITNWISNFQGSFVNKFILNVSDPATCRHIMEQCVKFATQHGVKDLRLDFSDPKWDENEWVEHDALMKLPEHVYGHGSSLEAIKLHSCSFSMPKFLNFGALKDVSLGWIELNIKTLKTMLSSCKMIENLTLKKCWNMEDFYLGDNNVGLKRLVIDKCQFQYEYLVFKAQSLKYFKYSGGVGFSEINVLSSVIEEVEIDYSLMPDFSECGDQIYKLVEDLSACRVLTVCSFLLQAIPSGEESVKVQCCLNIRHLIMKTRMHPYEMFGFMFLLNSSPVLEKLTIEIGHGKIFESYEPPFQGFNTDKFWQQPLITPVCLKKAVKVVEIKGFRGTENELLAVKYIVENGKVLEEVSINMMYGNLEEEKLRLVRRFCTVIPKASNKLKISVA